MAFYSRSGLLGVDLNVTTTGQMHQLGSMVEGSDGTLWQYVQAVSAVSAYAVVAIGQSTASSSGIMAMASVADAVAGYQLAVSQQAFAASEYGWVPIRGTGGQDTQMRVLCSSTMSAGNALYIGTKTGSVSIQASSSATVKGIMVYGASGADEATVTSLPCIVSWPRCNYSGA